LEIIAGVDEAGRGPLAGPVVAAAVVLNDKIEGLNDSKKLSAKKRNELFSKIYENAKSVGVGIVDVKEIDRINILAATHKAMQIALGRISLKPDLALIDGYELPNQIIRNEGVVKGDTKVQEIMAASIIAKVTRDNIMQKYDIVFPEYGFAKHKGYGTKQHMEALAQYKASPIHRKSFKPVKQNLPTITWLSENKRVGVVGEQLAAYELIKSGHKILHMNEILAPFGEIDIISKIDDLLVFHEVKTIAKEQIGAPELKIDVQKLKKLERAINLYLEKNQIESDIRLDAIAIKLGKKYSIKKYEGIELNFD